VQEFVEVKLRFARDRFDC